MSLWILLLSVIACAVIRAASCWEDPVPVAPTVIVEPYPGDMLTGRLGDELQLHCFGTNTSNSYGRRTRWYQIRGNLEVRLTSDHGSESTLKKTLTESDSGTVIHCRVSEKLFHTKGKLFDFVANSKSIMLTVTRNDGTRIAAVEWTAPTIPAVTVSPAPGDVMSQYKVGDEVRFTCRCENMKSGHELGWHQVKDSLEISHVHTTATNKVNEITFATKVTLRDDSTKLYCWMWYTDESDDPMMIKSDYIILRVRGETNSNDVSSTNDPDFNFFVALLPDIKKIPENQKIFFKSEMLELVQKYQPFQYRSGEVTESTDTYFSTNSYADVQ